MKEIAIVIHGGAGQLTRGNLSVEAETGHLEVLNEALATGYEFLKKGGDAKEAIVLAIQILENSKYFNAGRGAVYSANGTQEMDAAIMCGKTEMAGGVTGITGVKNPILLAKEVMEHSPHVLLMGEGAVTFAEEQGLEMKGPEYFHEEGRYQRWLEMKNQAFKPDSSDVISDKKMGTVGAVALDQSGNLAAATSTGGMTNKKYGRIGDSPIIGAGTFARNKTCAVSCTGHGEPFIRQVVGYDLSCLMEYKGWSLNKAADHIVNEKLVKIEALGGLISLDQSGNISMPFNTTGMYRGFASSSKGTWSGIYKEEE